MNTLRHAAFAALFAVAGGPASAFQNSPFPPGAPILKPIAGTVLHDPFFTVIHTGTAANLPLNHLGATTVDTVTGFKCNNDVLGCTIVVDNLLGIRCGNFFPATYSTLVSVDGAFAPNTYPLFNAFPSDFPLVSRDAVHVDKGKHKISVQIFFNSDDDPVCTLQDWEIDYAEYTP